MNYNNHQNYYYSNGKLQSEVYYLNDKCHRTDGPAYISYYENGNIESESYCSNNKLHRTDGPAYIHYYVDGNIEYRHYYLDSKFIDVDSDKEFQKHVKTLILK